MLLKGIPDEAYEPLIGDDKKLAREYARINKKQKESVTGQPELITSWTTPEALMARNQELRNMVQDNLSDAQAKEERYAAIHQLEEWQRLKIASDIYISASFYMAAFFTPKVLLTLGALDVMPLTEHIWRSTEGLELPDHLLRGARITSEKIGAFHWFIEFPEIMEREQGFDVVIGNPPWERIKLQEQEFFAVSAPEIANASNKAARQVLIDALQQAEPDSADSYLSGRGDINTYALFAELFSQLAKPSGRAGLLIPTGIATDMTTSLFFGDLVSKKYLSQLIDFENSEPLFPAVHRSFKFCILSMGASEKTSFAFFLTNTDQLEQEERRFTLTSQEITRINPNTRTAPVFRSRADADLTTKLYAHTPVLIEERPESESGDINPWGITFQRMFDMSNDSGLFKTAVQMRTSGWACDENNWINKTKNGTERYVPLYEAKMIHHFNHRWATYDIDMVGDKKNIRDCSLIEKQSPNFELSPCYWVPEQEVVLRAARMPADLVSAIRQICDKRGLEKFTATLIEKARLSALKTLVVWITGAFVALEGRPAQPSDIFKFLGPEQDWRAALGMSLIQFLTSPYIRTKSVQMQKETPLLATDLERMADARKDIFSLLELLTEIKQPRWLIGCRGITNATNERTIIASVFPKIGVGNSIFLIHSGITEPKRISCLLGCLSSLVCDYIARQKIGGTNMNFFLFQQFPVFSPSAFSTDDLNFINPRVLELTYTSYSMKPWAEDLGYSGLPFTWNEERRAQLRAELDVFFARKYGITEEELKFILDPAQVKGTDYPSETFRVLKENEIKNFGKYRTEHLILDQWKQMGY
jgi:hypothetical protein